MNRETFLLDIACENLKQAIKKATVTTQQQEIKKKWAAMALTSSRQKAARK